MVEAQGGQVCQLPLSDATSRSDALLVEVLDPHQEVAARRPSRQPGDERCPEIAQMEIAGRRRGETSGGHGPTLTRMLQDWADAGDERNERSE